MNRKLEKWPRKPGREELGSKPMWKKRMERHLRGMKSGMTDEKRDSTMGESFQAAPDKRLKLQRNENQNISEVIAPGMPNPQKFCEVQYDQRVFNQPRGVESDFAGREDEIYNVYD